MKNTYSIAMKDICLAWPNNRPYVVDWGSGLGFGAPSEAEALALAERYLPNQLKNQLKHVHGGVCVEISRFCETCKITGIKPGCKRKKCPDCNGRGTVGRYGFPILKDGIEP